MELKPPSLVACKACGQNISPAAKACIHCGHPTRERHLLNSGVIAASVIVAVFLMILLGWPPFVAQFVSNNIAGFRAGFEGHPSLPSCDSAQGQADAKRALENSPTGKIEGLSIVAFTYPTAVSLSSEKVECRATVILNNADKAVMDYSFSYESSLPRGTYYIRTLLHSDREPQP
jgi:hypothetical protein